MRAPDARIHLFRLMDGRVKPGHDEVKNQENSRVGYSR
jgi:hypothetical protein